MKDSTPTTVAAVVTHGLESRAENNFDSPETVEATCLCCSADQFRFVTHLDREGETWARYECVGCGATRDRRVPSPRGETA